VGLQSCGSLAGRYSGPPCGYSAFSALSGAGIDILRRAQVDSGE
jgi:hypothetical protein